MIHLRFAPADFRARLFKVLPYLIHSGKAFEPGCCCPMEDGRHPSKMGCMTGRINCPYNGRHTVDSVRLGVRPTSSGFARRWCSRGC
jgi:hypothetical protein